MGNTIASLIVLSSLMGLFVWVVKSWLRWHRSGVTEQVSGWRVATTVFGLGAATLSLSIIIVIAAHAMITGGLSYYHPIFLAAASIGILAALSGLLAGIIGAGQLERPTLVCSSICLVIWVIEGIAQ